jgi:hypothetical protein
VPAQRELPDARGEHHDERQQRDQLDRRLPSITASRHAVTMPRELSRHCEGLCRDRAEGQPYSRQ